MPPQVTDPAATEPAAAGSQTDPEPEPQQEPEPEPQAAEPKTPRTVPVAELAKERAARKKAEDELKKLQDAQLSETDKLRKQVADYERQIADAQTRDQESRVRIAVIGSAAKLGYSDADDALRLVDRSAIEFDDAGQPINVDDLLGGLLKSKPYLASAHATPQGGIDLGNAGAPAFTKAQIAKMTPDQVNANWDKIQQAAKSGKLS